MGIVIDRRSVLLGGLAGLAAPSALHAQGGGGGGGGPGGGPGGNPGGGLQGGGGIGNQGQNPTGSRIGNRNEGLQSSSAQQPDTAPRLPQPPQIRAFVLGQGYSATPRFALANATRDAELMAESFRRLRLDAVTMHLNGAPAETMARIGDYLRSVDANTIALVYVAGHGLEIGGENLLMLEGGETFLSLQALVQVLRARAGIAILLLDACRNNPLQGAAPPEAQVARAVQLSGETTVRLQTTGLAEVRAAATGAGRLRPFSLQGSGIRIIFSTDPANVALDGVRGSRNGPFAQALARHIRQPLSLDDIVSLTTGDVLRATRRRQSPWSQGSIDRPIYLSGRRRHEQQRLDRES